MALALALPSHTGNEIGLLRPARLARANVEEIIRPGLGVEFQELLCWRFGLRGGEDCEKGA